MLPARQSYVALWRNDSPLGGGNPMGRERVTPSRDTSNVVLSFVPYRLAAAAG
jgi:hypothetical protein